MPPKSALSGNLADVSAFTLAKITRLARLTGVSISGRKTDVTERLTTSLYQPKLAAIDPRASANKSKPRPRDGFSKAHRILSIDMGIRNLAYCRLLVNKEQEEAEKPSNPQDVVPLGPVSVEAWSRFDVGARKVDATLAQNESDDDSAAGESKQALSRKSFTPTVMSKHALALLRSLVLDAPEGPPDTILIERQRWRSGGHASIQEWTLRVNSFEAMLWAGLEVLRDQGAWTGSLYAVDPGAVARFWVNDQDPAGDLETAKKTKMKKEERTKTAKMNVAKRWITKGVFMEEGDQSDVGVKLQPGHGESSSVLEWLPSVSGMKLAFLDGYFQDRTAPSTGKPLKLTKRDDLADCLLQGVAWVKWEQNRRAIVSGRAILDVPASRSTKAPRKV